MTRSTPMEKVKLPGSPEEICLVEASKGDAARVRRTPGTAQRLAARGHLERVFVCFMLGFRGSQI